MFKILVVDHEIQTGNDIKKVLEEVEGSLVCVCTSSTAAIETSGKWGPDIVLMDALLPGMSGFEAAKRIRAVYPEIPVIMMAENGYLGIQSHEMGMQGFIAKPLRMEKLVQAVKRVKCRYIK